MTECYNTTFDNDEAAFPQEIPEELDLDNPTVGARTAGTLLLAKPAISEKSAEL